MSTRNTSPAIGNFEQPVLAIVDPQAFQVVRSAIASAFSSGNLTTYLKSLERQSLRVRDFESVMSRQLLGAETEVAYNKLGNADQGQIREFYLASLELVTPELRKKFLKLYSYY